MQITTKKMLRLLEPEQPLEVRCAAAVVLGELGVRDAELSKALCASLQDTEPAVRLQAIKAAGKLHIDPALPTLLERIKEGGPEAEEAALAVARLGVKGTRALQELMPRVAPGLRRYIGAALASGGPSGGESAAGSVLLDRDPGVIEAAVRSLIGQVPTMAPAQRRALADQLLQMSGDKKTPLPSATEAAVVRLLAALDDPRAEAALWDRILPPHAPEVRAAALQALAKWVNAPTKDRLKRLFTCAADPDFRVAAPALMTLKSLPASDKTLPEWLSLLQAPDVAVRNVALEKVGDRDRADVAEALLKQLGHADRSLREGALARLTRLEHGRQALTEALRQAETPDRAWSLARAQAPFARDYPAAARDALFEQACTYLEANDRRAEAVLFLLREGDAADLRDRLERRALAYRKKKDYATALLYLRLLGRDPASGFSVRFELAACGLKVSNHELTAEARAGDPCLQQFAHLCQNYEAELGKELEKAKWLEAEDLYYLGFHFTEKEGQQKQFGGKVLHLLLKRSPRSKVGQSARSKLRSEGLD